MRKWTTRWLMMLPIFALTLTGVVAAEEPAYLGAKKCKKCHLKQFKSWEETRMAQSFELLKPGVNAEAKTAAGLEADKDYTGDAACLPCHTTGYGELGGFTSVTDTPHLVGVQCESCHGPGSEYLKDGRMTNKNKEFKTADLVPLGLVVPHAETCTGTCHNDGSPFTEAGATFDFDARKDEGTHEHFAMKFEH